LREGGGVCDFGVRGKGVDESEDLGRLARKFKRGVGSGG